MRIKDWLENNILYLSLFIAGLVGFFFYWTLVVLLYIFGLPILLIEKINNRFFKR